MTKKVWCSLKFVPIRTIFSFVLFINFRFYELINLTISSGFSITVQDFITENLINFIYQHIVVVLTFDINTYPIWILDVIYSTDKDLDLHAHFRLITFANFMVVRSKILLIHCSPKIITWTQYKYSSIWIVCN